MKTFYETVLSIANDEARAMMNGATVLSANNVADYFMLGTPQDSWDVEADFPNVAPPFEKFFIEFWMPDQVNCGNGFQTSALARAGMRERCGVMFHVVPAADDLGWIFLTKGVAQVFEAGQEINFSDTAQWMFCVNKSGRVVKLPGKPHALIALMRKDIPAEQRETEELLYRNALEISLLAICFLHCKNVDLVEHGAQTMPKGARSRRASRIKYYTLEIDPMKKTLRTEGQSDSTGLKRALHICRGHFAHYTAERRLFGKYEGTFWHPMHVRGSKDAGEVIKDYKIGKVDGDPE